jgi:shikimate dehydrogenase
VRRLYVLLGDPVAHSRSPAIHARAFALLGEDAVYAPLRVEAAQLPVAWAGLKALGVAGFNVTVPHKSAAAALCDNLSQQARLANATNCVVYKEGRFLGHNTDGAGLLQSLRQAGFSPDGAKAAVLGAGGSASAAALALSGRASHLALLNRTAGKAKSLAAVLRAGGAQAAGFSLDDEGGKSALAAADLVVHCSTVGMGDDRVLIDPALLKATCTVVDLVYAGAPGSAPGETALLRAARARGLRTVDGVDVLVHQAIASLEIWLGRPELGHLAPELRAAATASSAAATTLPAESP